MSPRTLFQVQGAANTTRWTLSSNTTPAQSPKAFESRVVPDMMQANARYFDRQREHSLPRYESYDGSQYSHASGRFSASDYQAPEPMQGGNFAEFDFQQQPHMEERASLNVNTRVRSHQHQHQTHDSVGRHLLYETALLDTQTFEILELGEVDALKKEHARLNAKLEAAQRKLALESKVRDAAQNLQRLYSTNTKNRPDTPQDPESPKKNRSSLLGTRHRGASGGGSGGTEALLQADGELASSVKKVDELHEQVKSLLERREYVERKLLRHTAAVLAEEANRVAESAVPGLVNGHHIGDDDDDDDHVYEYNDFDGIRDILHGMPAGASNKVHQQEQQLASMQDRLEQLNSQLRNVISEAGHTLGRPVSAEIGLDQSDDSTARLENRLHRLEHNLQALRQQQKDIRAHNEQIQESEQYTRNTVEHNLEGLNAQLHGAVLLASNDQPVPGLEEPPQASGKGYQDQLQYMEESLMTIEQLLQQHNQSDDAQTKAEANAHKAAEYETVVGGLWEILQSDNTPSPRIGYDEDDEPGSAPPTPGMQEPFSLQAFSSRVQHIFDRAQAAKEQQEILRRQIQQQRDLNGKSDAEKDAQLADLQTSHHQLGQDHEAVQQELANAIVRHEGSASEAEQARSELQSTMTEVESLKQTIEAKQAERDDLARQTNDLHQRVQELEQQVEEFTEDEGEAERKHADIHRDMEGLETEVVRLTTELTMAKAELDGAYGTREERKGAQAAEVGRLTERNATLEERKAELEGRNEELERELRGSVEELQDLTKESLELEKEREQLDGLIDGLRERCEGLEAQVADERVRWLGARSPPATGGGGGGGGGADGQVNGKELRGSAREGVSMGVMRQEFKKMMREQRAEGIKLLRVSFYKPHLSPPACLCMLVIFRTV